MSDVGTNISKDNAGWNFEEISGEFDEHVRRSVPLYDEGHELVCQISDFVLPQNDAVVLELGTSTGALAERFLRHNAQREDLRYIGLDRVGSMLDEARKRLAADTRAEFVEEDLLIHPFEKCNMVLSYYSIQFVHPRHRQDVFNRIYEALEWGGAFLLFEKVRAPDARFQDMAAQIYHEYKLQQGFSEEEILNKQRSLKGVLEPFSTQGNLDLLERAGFVDVMTVMKWVCFQGFLAIK